MSLRISFEAVASAQETGLVPVLRAPSRTIEEAASDVKKLVAPSDVPPQTRERLKSSQRGGRRFGCFDGEQAATTLLSEIDYERCLREFEDAFEKGHLGPPQRRPPVGVGERAQCPARFQRSRLCPHPRNERRRRP